jgi:hypothetical protein
VEWVSANGAVHIYKKHATAVAAPPARRCIGLGAIPTPLHISKLSDLKRKKYKIAIYSLSVRQGGMRTQLAPWPRSAYLIKKLKV